MIKLFGLITRRPDMTPEAFHDHYRHPHGTLALKMTTLRGYVQSHQLHSDLLDTNQARFEAVAEIWLDNESDVVTFREEPNLVRYLIPDEPNFIDMSKSGFVATTETPVDMAAPPSSEADGFWSPASRPFSIKLIQLVLHDGAWFGDEDAALAGEIGALRHVRCAPVAAFQPEKPEFFGVRELWWPTLAAFRAGVGGAPGAWRRLQEITGPSVSLLAQAERLI